MGIFSRRLVLHSVSVPLACLMVALFLPTTVRAGCDYPTHIERTPVDLDAVFAKTTAKPNADMPIPGKPCPCSGPTCSRQPLAPSAPTSIVSVKISEWGRLVPRLVLASPQADTHVGGELLQLPVLHPSSIYHPPRLPI